MEAYSSYILNAAHERASELHRETAEYELSSAARSNRNSLWTRIVVWSAHPVLAAQARVRIEVRRTRLVVRSR